MTLRSRIGAAAGLAVAAVVVAVAVAVYVADRSQLRGQVDKSLTDVARRYVLERGAPGGEGPPPGAFGRGPFGRGEPPRQNGLGEPPPPGAFGGPSGYVQFVHTDGGVFRPPGETRALPVDARTLAVARSARGSFFADATVDRIHLRVLTAPDADGGAVEVARPLTEVDRALSRLLTIVVVAGLAGIALAALGGVLVARAALAPVVAFARRTETLTAAADPSQRLEIGGRDELGRLARSFNTTLDALERSVEAQRQLVADASHELRTPIASLRANIQVLADADRLPPDERERLRADIIEELDSLTALVGDVVELARGTAPTPKADDVALDEIVEAAVARTRARRPDLQIELDATPALVRGAPDRITRAVVNVLDNAVKWSPAEGAVEVTVHDAVLAVRDHGPGFDAADLPHVFDRFYRAEHSRTLPGSGLGLAIVRQAAEAHGGYARATNADGGGARVEVYFGPPAASRCGANFETGS